MTTRRPKRWPTRFSRLSLDVISRLRHPQLFVLPLMSSAAPTTVRLPQSHRHFHRTLPDADLLLTSRITMSRPKRWPKRLSFLDRLSSLERHPQLLVRPYFKLPSKIETLFPQSQRHFHRLWPNRSRFLILASTRSRPNRRPISLSFPGNCLYLPNLNRTLRPPRLGSPGEWDFGPSGVRREA